MAASALTKDTFQTHIGQGITRVDFWAPWCGPCKIQLPIVEELAVELKDQVKVTKVNVDDEQELAAEYCYEYSDPYYFSRRQIGKQNDRVTK